MSAANIKPEREEIEKASPTGDILDQDLQDSKGSAESIDDDPVYTYKEQRKIIHRLDRRLITIAGIIYMNSLMDRSNLPNAAIAGMRVDLEMLEGFRYVCVASNFCCRCQC